MFKPSQFLFMKKLTDSLFAQNGAEAETFHSVFTLAGNILQMHEKTSRT